ncbi:uncharacterized protein SPAPADRAFT_50884 [Spathaspora passalidarum NRRL Y-27907]|uniref:P/Homo B domain-containing protein n=1 Tax=Spathaspora passalidarum (strain NRRL Y-27907 / 11-Y1) TaxID=619300 RepID=G3APZ6_SPAPN|nr:uncharacterized protein SPAPADRAFT_50884 [Spathaspora passalidarum NRRL Y-27907]EGW32317.1 hypothetical protein SPAPADRAFT_50884 [Spathaspora passalidarum NRRL Y-27907]
MLLYTILLLLYFISISLQRRLLPQRDYEHNNYFLVELDTSSSEKPLLDFIKKYKSDYVFDHQLPIDNYYVFKINKTHRHNSFLVDLASNNFAHSFNRKSGFDDLYNDFINNHALKSVHLLPPKRLQKRRPVQVDPAELDAISRARRNQLIEPAKQKLEEVASKLNINDPTFGHQWHLINTISLGNDINIADLWLEGKFGEGIVTAVVDDGLDSTSEDLRDNFNFEGSWDFNDNSPLPLPRLFDDSHGTKCAGEVSAVKNNFCGIGVAFKSQVSGIRILSGSLTDADEAAAMVYGLDINDIYSCSWGPTDNGKTLSEPHPIVKEAILKGVIEGRDSKGALYVFASGNGAKFDDSCNFDGYTNSIYTITVGAIDYKGSHPDYSEGCSALMVVSYSSGSGVYIHTTDINQQCSSMDHGGTSAAAPLASAIYALVLEANPELTWRDVQYITVLTAVPINEDDGSYQTTSIGRKYSPKYGYGKLDATKMVHFAEEWKNVKPQAWYYSDLIIVTETITYDKKVIESSVFVSEEDLKLANLERVEHAAVKVNIKSSYRGAVGMRLISPEGVISDLATFRKLDDASTGFRDWTFMSVAHWGESGVGEWKVEVFGEADITFVDWQLRLFGESIDAGKTTKFSLRTDYADVQRELKNQNPANDQPKSSSTTETIKYISSSFKVSEYEVLPVSSIKSPLPEPSTESSQQSSSELSSSSPTTTATKSLSSSSSALSSSSILSTLATVSVLSSLAISSTPILSSSISEPPTFTLSSSISEPSSLSVLTSISLAIAIFLTIFFIVR